MLVDAAWATDRCARRLLVRVRDPLTGEAPSWLVDGRDHDAQRMPTTAAGKRYWEPAAGHSVGYKACRSMEGGHPSRWLASSNTNTTTTRRQLVPWEWDFPASAYDRVEWGSKKVIPRDASDRGLTSEWHRILILLSSAAASNLLAHDRSEEGRVRLSNRKRLRLLHGWQMRQWGCDRRAGLALVEHRVRHVRQDAVGRYLVQLVVVVVFKRLLCPEHNRARRRTRCL